MTQADLSNPQELSHGAPDPFTIRYAETDIDCWLLFQFLMTVAQPVLIGNVDEATALGEIMRVRDHGAPITAFLGEQIVGALGLIRAQFWYGGDYFLADRWYFVAPGFRSTSVGARLLAEGHAVATSSGLPVIIQGKIRPRNSGVFFTSPRVFLPPNSGAPRH